jgi:hypothetical protein
MVSPEIQQDINDALGAFRTTVSALSCAGVDDLAIISSMSTILEGCLTQAGVSQEVRTKIALVMMGEQP